MQSNCIVTSIHHQCNLNKCYECIMYNITEGIDNVQFIKRFGEKCREDPEIVLFQLR